MLFLVVFVPSKSFVDTHTMRNVLFFKRQKTYISLLGWKPNEDLQQFILKWENLCLSLKGTNEFKKCLITVLHDEESDWFVVSEYIVDLEWLEDEKKQVILLGAPITCSNASRNFFCPFYLPINNAATRQFSNRTGKRTETKEAAIEEFPTNDAAIFGTEKGHFFAVIISLSENLKKSSCNSAIFQDFWKFNAKMGEFLCPHLETWLVHWVQNLRRRKTESYLKRKKKSPALCIWVKGVVRWKDMAIRG